MRPPNSPFHVLRQLRVGFGGSVGPNSTPLPEPGTWLSLLLITIQHIPSILKKKGRNALIGVVTTHLGILIIIAGIIYGGFTGFRHHVKLIEGEVTILPDLPFVIQLERIEVEEYRQEDFPRMNLAGLPKKKQDTHLTGTPFIFFRKSCET